MPTIKDMREALKKKLSKPADALQAAVAAAQEERAALSAMLKQIKPHAARMSKIGASVKQVTERASRATATLEDLSSRLSAVEATTESVNALEGRVQSLVDSVDRAQRTAQNLLAADGDLAKHRQAVQQLTKQGIEATANFNALDKERAILKRAQEELRQTQTVVKASSDKSGTLADDLDRLGAQASQLHQDHDRLSESLRKTRENADQTTRTVRDVEEQLGPLTQLHELSKTTDERLYALNTLAEHVLSKVKSLESQKQTVEHAVVESNRLSEMVWKMEVQIGTLDDANKQAAQVDETAQRIEQVSKEITARFEQGEQIQESYTTSLAALETRRTELVEFVKDYTERLAIERKTLDGHDGRVRTLQSALSGVEHDIGGLSQKAGAVAAMQQRADDLGGQLEGFGGRVQQLEARAGELEKFEKRMSGVEALIEEVERRQTALAQGRSELDALRMEVDQFHVAHADVVKSRDQINTDRGALEAFVSRIDEFRRRMPELESGMDEVSKKLSVVDEATQRAASLETTVDDLDNRMARVADHQQLVANIGTRLDALNTLSASIDERVAEQLTRQQAVEALKNACDGVDVQIDDAQQKLQTVAALQNTLLPLTTQVAALKTRIDGLAAACKDYDAERADLTAQERRISEAVDRSRDVATTVDDQIRRVEGASEELGRVSALKDELLQELGRAQTHQRYVSARMKTADEQIKRVDVQLVQLDQRHSRLAFSDKRIAAAEKRITELQALEDRVERQMQAVIAHGDAVGAVKKEVDNVHQISQQSKTDLQEIIKQRTQIDTLHRLLNAARKRVGETERQVAAIESRKAMIGELQLKTNMIGNVLKDVHVNLELLAEQRAIVDHAVEGMARVQEDTRSAQATLKALQAERQLAERIERGIKRLRTERTARWTDEEAPGEDAEVRRPA